MEKAKILIVEDEGIIAKDLQLRLKDMGYNVPSIVNNGEEALKKVKEIKPNLVLMDIVLIGQMDGIETAGKIRLTADIPVIYLTAYADEETLERAKITEPFGYLIKPVNDKELHSAISIALYRHSMERELIESRKWFSTLLNSVNDGVITTDAKGNVIHVNPAAETLTGWKQKEVTGNALEEVFNIENTKAVGEVVGFTKKRMGPEIIVALTNDTILITWNKTRIHIDISASPVKDEKGDVNGVVLVVRDSTEHKDARME